MYYTGMFLSTTSSPHTTVYVTPTLVVLSRLAVVSGTITAEVLSHVTSTCTVVSVVLLSLSFSLTLSLSLSLVMLIMKFGYKTVDPIANFIWLQIFHRLGNPCLVTKESQTAPLPVVTAASSDRLHSSDPSGLTQAATSKGWTVILLLVKGASQQKLPDNKPLSNMPWETPHKYL